MSIDATVLPMGDAALLVEVADIDTVLALDAVLTQRVDAGEGVWEEVGDLVPAARTVLVVARPDTDLSALRSALRDAIATVEPTSRSQISQVIEVPVRYDGPDLDEVAQRTGLTRDDVIAAHTGTPWRVGFGGFAPGFAYLVGGDPRLVVPRRDSPRTKVPAGAVALAGEFSAVYPRESPGGWQLIGTTELVMWDIERESPALMTPGATVRFMEVS